MTRVQTVSSGLIWVAVYLNTLKDFLYKVAPEFSRYIEYIRSTSKYNYRSPFKAELLKLESEKKN